MTKGKALADEGFVSKIEPIVNKYDLEKIESLKNIKELKESVDLKIKSDSENLYNFRLEANKKFLEPRVKNLDSIIAGAEIDNYLSDNEIRQYSMFLKASAIYSIKEDWKVAESFNNSLSNSYFYHFQNVSQKLNQDSSPLKVKKELCSHYKTQDIECFIDNLIAQLVDMNPEVLTLKKKDAELGENFLKELSTVCSPIGFFDKMKAKVSDCLITKNLENSLSAKEYEFSPGQRINSGTILTLDHPIVKKLVMNSYDIIVGENSEVEFDIDLSMPLKELINDPFAVREHFHNYFLPGIGSSVSVKTKFDSLFAKRKLKEIEVVHSFIKLPGNVKFVYDYY